VSKEAMLPCIACGAVLQNSYEDAINQPSEGTEFATYGHYGSTFWDSFNGEQIVINVCDECLRKNTDRIARQQRFRKLVVEDSRGTIPSTTVVGRNWVDRAMVPWFEGSQDEDEISIEPEEVGVMLGYNIEWVSDWREIKQRLVRQIHEDMGNKHGCLHMRFAAECLDCGARPLEGLR
jgi:hypothetical protein